MVEFLYVVSALFNFRIFLTLFLLLDFPHEKKVDFQGSGELKPGRKGISLSGEQYQRLKAIMSEIDEKLTTV